jgi:hypothetical protein
MEDDETNDKIEINKILNNSPKGFYDNDENSLNFVEENYQNYFVNDECKKKEDTLLDTNEKEEKDFFFQKQQKINVNQIKKKENTLLEKLKEYEEYEEELKLKNEEFILLEKLKEYENKYPNFQNNITKTDNFLKKENNLKNNLKNNENNNLKNNSKNNENNNLKNNENNNLKNNSKNNILNVWRNEKTNWQNLKDMDKKEDSKEDSNVNLKNENINLISNQKKIKPSKTFINANFNKQDYKSIYDEMIRKKKDSEKIISFDQFFQNTNLSTTIKNQVTGRFKNENRKKESKEKEPYTHTNKDLEAINELIADIAEANTTKNLLEYLKLFKKYQQIYKLETKNINDKTDYFSKQNKLFKKTIESFFFKSIDLKDYIMKFLFSCFNLNFKKSNYYNFLCVFSTFFEIPSSLYFYYPFNSIGFLEDFNIFKSEEKFKIEIEKIYEQIIRKFFMSKEEGISKNFFNILINSNFKFYFFSSFDKNKYDYVSNDNEYVFFSTLMIIILFNRLNGYNFIFLFFI